MTKRKDTKAKAFTCRGAAALITAALLTAAVLLTGCPQSIENKPNIPSGSGPNLRIEGGILKGWNETPPSGTLVIPAGVTEVADGAFWHCTGLTEVNFPASLKTIGDRAFKDCTGLTQVHFPASLTKIDSFAFDACVGISALDFSACTQPLSIDISAFCNCIGLSGTVVLPASLKTIGDSAFYNCNKVDAFDFTQCTQLTYIGSWAFRDCKADAVFTVKAGGGIKNLLLDSHSGINASQITEGP